VGCSTAKKSAPATKPEAAKSPAKKSSPKFLDDIAISPEAGGKKHPKKMVPTVENSSENATGSIKFKYAILLDVPIEEINDQKLFDFIESWYGTPYRYGGFNKQGIDCSAFVQTFMSAIYDVNVPRISSEQYEQSKRISKKELEEGDLVFFKTSGRSISHVGIYLRNNKFVHASTSSGVVISDLAEDYYARRFAGSGRVR
jgi:lipoprotein Spr